MKIFATGLVDVGSRLERAFGNEVCDEPRALRHLADARLVDNRRKRVARNFLRQISNKTATCSVDTLTTIAEHWTVARTYFGNYYFFRHNTALGDFPQLKPFSVYQIF